MLSFHNDPAVKTKYLKRVQKHRKADNIIQGTGWNNGKGCAVGCTLESYDHERYPIELGLPVWLARLEDTIFEGLSHKEAMKWPERFLKAIPVGVNVEMVRHKLAIKRMDRLLTLQKQQLKQYPELQEVITKVIGAIKLVKEYHKNPGNEEKRNKAEEAAK